MCTTLQMGQEEVPNYGVLRPVSQYGYIRGDGDKNSNNNNNNNNDTDKKMKAPVLWSW